MPVARVVIVTEGTRTEPEYFKIFVRIHGARTVEVVPIGLGGDPRKVVERAIIELSELRKDPLGGKDSVWAVYENSSTTRKSSRTTILLRLDGDALP